MPFIMMKTRHSINRQKLAVFFYAPIRREYVQKMRKTYFHPNTSLVNVSVLRGGPSFMRELFVLFAGKSL